jgi:hypothetical protein
MLGNHATRRRQSTFNILFHPDCTVGPGVTPDLLTPRERALAGYTAGGELHPALRIPGTSKDVPAGLT